MHDFKRLFDAQIYVQTILDTHLLIHFFSQRIFAQWTLCVTDCKLAVCV